MLTEKEVEGWRMPVCETGAEHTMLVALVISMNEKKSPASSADRKKAARGLKIRL